MFLKETLEILEKLLNDCDLTEIQIGESKIIVHADIDKQEEWKTEYDLLIKQRVNHATIQQIDKLLSNYDSVEMEVIDEGLRIFEREA